MSSKPAASSAVTWSGVCSSTPPDWFANARARSGRWTRHVALRKALGDTRYCCQVAFLPCASPRTATSGSPRALRICALLLLLLLARRSCNQGLPAPQDITLQQRSATEGALSSGRSLSPARLCATARVTEGSSAARGPQIANCAPATSYPRPQH